MTTTSEDAKSYLANKNIPALFESLMTGLMYNRPTDHITYLQECLGAIKEEGVEGIRWNAFIQLELSQKLKTPLPPIPAKDAGKTASSTSIPTDGVAQIKRITPLPPIGQTTQAANTSVYNIPQCPIVFVFGGPGSGKHTQIKRLLGRYEGWVHLSMGDILRQEIADNGTATEKWSMIVNLVNKGELAPQDVALDLLGNNMAKQQTAAGIIVEGFPRTMDQVQLYANNIGRVDLVMMIDCEEQACTKRLINRLKDAGQSQDNLTAIANRIARFKTCLPVAKHYDDQQKVAVIEGDKSADAVFFDICSVFEHVFYNPSVPVPLGGSIKFPKPPPLSRPSSPGKRPRSRGKSSQGRPVSSLDKIEKIQVVSKDAGRKPGIPPCPIFFLMGGPGSGKGTHAARLVARYPGFVHLSMGDILRTYVTEKGTADDKWSMIGSLLQQGEMAPGDVTADLLVNSLKKHPDATAFIIEGYPRTKDQVEQFNDSVGGLSMAILLDCDEYYMQQRLTDRQAAQNRIDDNLKAIAKRISFFKYSTLPVAHYFDTEGKLVVVNGDRDIEEIFFELCSLFDYISKAQETTADQTAEVIEAAGAPETAPVVGDNGNPYHSKELDSIDQANLDMKEISDRTIVFVVGGPGSGKGTQCKKIAARYGFCHLSSGDLLRQEVQSGSELGKELTKIMESGALVPIETVLTLLKKAMLNNSTAKGFLVDGYPREVDQGKLFENEVKPCDFVLYFEVSDDSLVQRLLKRAETSGRADDNEETIKKRLATFHEKTQPLVDHYAAQDKTKKVPSEGTIDEIFGEVEKLFESLGIKGIDTDQLKDHDIMFVLGGPGSGKGTQCRKIMEKYGLTHLSSGDLLRQEMASGSSRGEKLREIMEKGELVPVDAVLELLKEAMVAKADSCKGFIIDGYPRQVDQAERFEEEVKPAKHVLFFDLSEDSMKTRLANRAQASDRVDDSEEIIQKRMATFNNLTKPTVEHFTQKEKLIKINAEGNIEEVFNEVEGQLEGKL